MCKRCSTTTARHAEAISAGPLHGITRTIVFLICEVVSQVAEAMAQDPKWLVMGEVNPDLANAEFNARVCDVFSKEFYFVARDSPDPQFEQIMHNVVLSTFAAFAAADSEGRTPLEYMQDRMLGQLEVMDGDSWDTFRLAMMATYEVEAVKQGNRGSEADVQWLIDAGIDPDILH